MKNKEKNTRKLLNAEINNGNGTGLQTGTGAYAVLVSRGQTNQKMKLKFRDKEKNKKMTHLFTVELRSVAKGTNFQHNSVSPPRSPTTRVRDSPAKRNTAILQQWRLMLSFFTLLSSGRRIRNRRQNGSGITFLYSKRNNFTIQNISFTRPARLPNGVVHGGGGVTRNIFGV